MYVNVFDKIHNPFSILPDLRQTQYFILLHKILMSFQTFYLFSEEPETRFIDIYRLYFSSSRRRRIYLET